jgi:hypothetical protein
MQPGSPCHGIDSAGAILHNSRGAAPTVARASDFGKVARRAN